jgi:hypothetical protein
MAQVHKDYVLSVLAVGMSPAELAVNTLASWSIPEDQVLALDPSYEFLPEDSYDAVCDVPGYASASRGGVVINPVNANQAAIVGIGSCSMDCSFVFLLRGNVC